MTRIPSHLNRGLPPAEEGDESIYKPDMDDLDPEYGDIDVLDLDELIEGRKKTDTWKNLEYLTQGVERKSKSNHKLVPIKRTKHEIQYINYLNKTYAMSEHNGQTYPEFLKNRTELNTIMTQIYPKRF
jgi:hypothetical protein